VFAGRDLRDGCTLAECGVGPEATLSVLLRLRGGKGGFGALLRGAGRAAQTENQDAMRDLSGRRLRHVNAEKKLQVSPTRRSQKCHVGGARWAATRALVCQDVCLDVRRVPRVCGTPVRRVSPHSVAVAGSEARARGSECVRAGLGGRGAQARRGGRGG
jgi:hypothetical protein